MAALGRALSGTEAGNGEPHRECGFYGRTQDTEGDGSMRKGGALWELVQES